ncbi:uncharacterized protein LOC135484291 [Lineus longissimus]|uniref:uncharacterized protein LOC135484291 n=1 Tax=Lineus longissimus TaxID=88925 RepID=UPI002B4EACF8
MNDSGDESLVNYLNGVDEGKAPSLDLVDNRSVGDNGTDDLDLSRPTADFDLGSDLQAVVSERSTDIQPLLVGDAPWPIKLANGDGRLLSIRKVMEPTVMKQIGDMMSPCRPPRNCAKSVPGRSSPDYSEYEESLVDENGKKMTRNAINARENRMRKKQFIEGLQKSVKDLSSENGALKRQVSDMQSTIESLTKDVLYLKGVLANQSHLSALLRNIHNTPGVNFSSSFELPAPLAEEDIDGDAGSPKTSRKRDNDCLNTCSNDEENQIPHPSTSDTPRSKVQKLDHAYNRPVTRRSPGTKNTDKQKHEKISDNDRQKESDKFRDLNLQDAGGVCLHVSKGNVSLEFCASCSRNAANGHSKDS